VPFVDREAVEAAAAQADVVEFFYGDPDAELIRLAKRHGAVAGWQVGSAHEAEAAIEAGCDYVAAQGVEAGGHVRGTQSLDDVLEATLRVVTAAVVAAGGIGSPDRVAQLLSNGASAVRIGTRFVAATESNAHLEYIDMLIQARAADTTLTEAFGVGWPNAPHRVLRSAIDAATSFDRDVVAVIGERQLPPFAPVPPTRQAEGAILAMALYAGFSVDHVTHRQPAAEIINELTSSLP
jgi:NAD(P)H-dependent flavin oxidoreductase YrpB (nitropropane dioxygenase family)